MQFHLRPHPTCAHVVKDYTVAFLAGSKVKASFSQSNHGQDNLCESLIRGVADPPTKSRVVKAKLSMVNSQGQFRMVKLLNQNS